MEQTNGSGQFLSFHDVLKRFIFLVHAFVNETWVRIWVNIRFSDFVSLELDTEIKQKKKNENHTRMLDHQTQIKCAEFLVSFTVNIGPKFFYFFLSQNLH